MNDTTSPAALRVTIRRNLWELVEAINWNRRVAKALPVYRDTEGKSIQNYGEILGPVNRKIESQEAELSDYATRALMAEAIPADIHRVMLEIANARDGAVPTVVFDKGSIQLTVDAPVQIAPGAMQVTVEAPKRTPLAIKYGADGKPIGVEPVAQLPERSRRGAF